MFEIKTRETLAGPRYDVINTTTGLPVVTWYNAGRPNELTDYVDLRIAQQTLEGFERGWLRDVRRPTEEREG